MDVERDAHGRLRRFRPNVQGRRKRRNGHLSAEKRQDHAFQQPDRSPRIPPVHRRRPCRRDSAAGGAPITTALVTGAAKGLGRAIALTLKARGLSVFGTSRDATDDTWADEYPILSMDVRS